MIAMIVAIAGLALVFVTDDSEAAGSNYDSTGDLVSVKDSNGVLLTNDTFDGQGTLEDAVGFINTYMESQSEDTAFVIDVLKNFETSAVTFGTDVSSAPSQNITLNMNGYSIETTGNIVIGVDSDVVINGAQNSDSSIASESASYLLQVKGSLSVNDVDLSGGKNFAVYVMNASSSFTLRGGTVTTNGSNTVQVNNGTVFIESGTVQKGSGAAIACSTGGSTTVTIGTKGGTSTTDPSIGHIYPRSVTFLFYSGNIDSAGGTFGSESVLEGSFDTLTSSNLPGGYLPQQGADGLWYAAALSPDNAGAGVTHDGKVTYYLNVQDAVKAVQDGDTLTFYKDYVGETGIEVNAKDVTIDLNGFDVSASTGYGLSVSYTKQTYEESSTTKVVNNGDAESEISGTPAVYLNRSGLVPMLGVIGEGIVLDSSSPIEIDGMAYLAYNSTTAEYFKVGGFITNKDSPDYIYGSLSAALDNSDGVVYLLNDYNGSISTTASEDFTLDLNDKKITYDGTDFAISVTNDDSNVVIRNGQITSTNGSGINAGANKQGYVENQGTVYIPNKNISLILEDVVVTCTKDYALYSNGSCENINITIRDSSLTCSNTSEGLGIYFPADGTLTVENSEITGATGVEIRKGSLTILGDETVITATAQTYNVSETPIPGGSTVTGAAIAISPYSNLQSITVSISDDGEFTGQVAFAQVKSDESYVTPLEYDFSIAGGTFKSTGIDTTTSQTYPAIVTVENEIEEKFVTGGKFISGSTADLSVQNYISSAYKIDTETGEVVPDSKNAVAEIDGEYFSSVAEALEAAEEGDVVNILLSKQLNSTVTIDCGITINLNGQSIVIYGNFKGPGLLFTEGSSRIYGGNINDNRGLSQNDGGLVAIKVSGVNTSLDMEANINFQSPFVSGEVNTAMEVTDGAKLTLDGATITGTTSGSGQTDGIGVYGPGNGGESTPTELIITNGSSISVRDFGVVGNGSVSGENDSRFTKITMDSGSISSTNGTAIFHPQIGTLEITGGNITGPTAIEMRAGTLKVSGDAIVKATNEKLDINPDPSEGNTIGGAAIAISQHSSSPDIDISIAGGTFSGLYGIYEADLFNDAKTDNISISVSAGDFSGCNTGVYSENVVGFIKGGTFSDDVSGYCADGWVPLPSEDGYVVYERWTVTFDVNGEKTYVYVSPGEKVPSTSIPKLPAETGFEYSWTSGDSTWDSSQPITSDITVEAVKSLVLSASISVGTDGMTLTVVPECAADGVTYKYSWSKDGDVIGSAEGASVVADGPGVYSVSVTATADNVDATVKAEISYRPTVTDPDEPATEFDITHSGQSLAETTVKTETIIITSSDDHTDIDMSFDFQTDDVKAKVEITGGVGGGNVTITVTTVSETSQEVIDQIIEDVKETVTDLQDDDVKSVDVSLGNVDLDWMIIKVPFSESPKGFVHTAEAYFINEKTGVYEQALSQVHGEEVWIYTQHNTPYVVVATSYSDQAITEADPRPVDPEPEEPDNPGIIIPPTGDDDYVPLPPTIVVDDSSSSDDDEMVKVAACAAAAVAAAIIALILVAEYRKR